MSAAHISVAIATRDRPASLARCLESLRAGRVAPGEVVVADQSGGPEARSVTAAANRPGLPVRWVDGGSGGLAGAQNAAFRNAAMPVVAVLDDDCVADPEWIAALDHAFAADPGLALVGGRVLPLPGSGGRVFAVASRTSPTRRKLGRQSAPWHVGSGNNFAVRREWFERVDGCDERLGPGTPGQGGLDMDLFYRLLRAGAPALYEPRAVVQHQPATRAGRLQRRRPYGYGMGAACGIYLRAGDLHAAGLLAAWLALRLRVLGSALASGRSAALREEALVLSGTAAGLMYGVRQPPRPGDGSRAPSKGAIS